VVTFGGLRSFLSFQNAEIRADLSDADISIADDSRLLISRSTFRHDKKGF